MFPGKISLAVIAVATCFSFVTNADAAFTVTFEQVGSDVVATGIGTIDTAALTATVGTNNASAYIDPFYGDVLIGPSSFGHSVIKIYNGASGAPSFGDSAVFLGASSGSGDYVGIVQEQVDVPAGYISGSPLSDTSTWSYETISSLGLNPGTYTSTWGSGPTADSFTVIVGSSDTAPVPEPASIAILGVPAVLTLIRRRRVTV